MSKFDKRKIAVTLACASLFSGKSQAMEKSSQPVAAVGGGIALARGDKPKTLFTGKYSFTELVRNRNKKKKPGEPSQYKNKESQKVSKPEPLKSAPKKGFEKGPYFNENTQKFKQQFSSNERAVRNFEKFQEQVLTLGVEGILQNNDIKSDDVPCEEDIPKDNKTLRLVLESACKVISGQVSMNMSQPNHENFYYVHVESDAGNFYVYPGLSIDCLRLYTGDNNGEDVEDLFCVFFK